MIARARSFAYVSPIFASLLAASALVPLTACSSTSAPASEGPIDLPVQERLPTSPAATSTEGTPSVEADGGVENAADGASASPAGEEQYKLPAWSREDVQPKSARFGESYGLETYRGTTLVVVLLEGYCTYCQSNSRVAEELQKTFASEGLEAQIVILGDANAEQFASRVSLPIFRDTDGNAWKEMRATPSKHDTFVFAPNGLRSYFWPGSYQGDAARWRVEIGDAVREVAKRRAP